MGGAAMGLFRPGLEAGLGTGVFASGKGGFHFRKIVRTLG